MSSFFEKLKRGMGAEVGTTEKEANKSKKPENNKEEAEVKPVRNATPNIAGGKEKLTQNFSLENLSAPEGELAVDLYQNEKELVIRSAIAGVKAEKLDVLIEGDVIVISGNREEPEEKEKCEYFSRECYFGPFSRKIISPVEIDSSRAKATMKEGVLIIRIPKIQRAKKVKVEVAKE